MRKLNKINIVMKIANAFDIPVDALKVEPEDIREPYSEMIINGKIAEILFETPMINNPKNAGFRIHDNRLEFLAMQFNRFYFKTIIIPFSHRDIDNDSLQDQIMVRNGLTILHFNLNKEVI